MDKETKSLHGKVHAIMVIPDMIILLLMGLMRMWNLHAEMNPQELYEFPQFQVRLIKNKFFILILKQKILIMIFYIGLLIGGMMNQVFRNFVWIQTVLGILCQKSFLGKAIIQILSQYMMVTEILTLIVFKYA